MRINFGGVSCNGYKTGKCCICGKRVSRKKKFTQTLNPWNKNEDGEVKSPEEINKEISKERNEWEELPAIHVKCEEELQKTIREELENIARSVNKNFALVYSFAEQIKYKKCSEEDNEKIKNLIKENYSYVEINDGMCLYYVMLQIFRRKIGCQRL